MYQSFRNCLILAVIFLTSIVASAAEKTIQAKVEAVDKVKSSITLDGLTLDVTRKTKITVDGKQSAIGSVRVNEKATVRYDDELEAAISITISEDVEYDEMATAKVMKSLQGEWRCISMEESGVKASRTKIKEENRRVVIKGNSFSMTRVKNGMYGAHNGKFEIDSNKGYFDFIGKNEEWTGIYELEGDTLKLCYRTKNNGACIRPTEFKTDNARTNISLLYTYKREKE